MESVPEGKLFFCNHCTVMPQDCPGCRLVPQLFVCEKPLVVAIELMSSAALPKLLSVVVKKVLHPQVPLVFVHWKSKLVGHNVAFGPGATGGWSENTRPPPLVTAASRQRASVTP